MVIKGDANYRRRLGDSRWSAIVLVTEDVPYFPGLAEQLDQEDTEWWVNDKRGMIQTWLPNSPFVDLPCIFLMTPLKKGRAKETGDRIS